MKNLFMLTIVGVLSVAQAKAECYGTYHAKKYDLEKNTVEGITALTIFGVSAAGIASLVGTPAVMGVAFSYTTTTGTAYLSAAKELSETEKVMSLINDAKAGDGLVLREFYQELVEDGVRAEMQDIAKFISEKNKERLFCKSSLMSLSTIQAIVLGKFSD